MDKRILEAFIRAVSESIKDEMLPMEPSELLNQHMANYKASDGSKLDLRKSSYKKIGKFLQFLDHKRYIDYSETRGKSH